MIQGLKQPLLKKNENNLILFTNAINCRSADAPPIMEYTFIEQTLQPGPTVSLKCSASGNPTPSMAWSLDGFKLPDHPR